MRHTDEVLDNGSNCGVPRAALREGRSSAKEALERELEDLRHETKLAQDITQGCNVVLKHLNWAALSEEEERCAWRFFINLRTFRKGY